MPLGRAKLIYKANSEFGRYRIVEKMYEGRPTRLLLAGSGAPQSGLALDDEPELSFDYIQRFMEIALSVQPKHVLVIGGGAFTLPRALIERLAIDRLDVVEIDPLLPVLARQYFGLPDDPRLHIHTCDGNGYLTTCRETYDLIILDVFNEYDIPAHFLTAEAAVLYRKCLTSHGVVALNFIGWYSGRKSQFTRELISSFGHSFKDIAIYPADIHQDKKEEQNLTLVAALSKIPPLDYLQSNTVEVA